MLFSTPQFNKFAANYKNTEVFIALKDYTYEMNKSISKSLFLFFLHVTSKNFQKRIHNNSRLLKECFSVFLKEKKIYLQETDTKIMKSKEKKMEFSCYNSEVRVGISKHFGTWLSCC